MIVVLCLIVGYCTSWLRQYSTRGAGLLRPPLALVSLSVLDEEGVLVPLVSRLVSSLCRSSPWTDWVNVTLRFTTATTVGMISCDVSAGIYQKDYTTDLRSWRDRAPLVAFLTTGNVQPFRGM
jgi:hypothetical protein